MGQIALCVNLFWWCWSWTWGLTYTERDSSASFFHKISQGLDVIMGLAFNSPQYLKRIKNWINVRLRWNVGETGELAKHPRAVAALLQQLGWVPSTHTAGLSGRPRHGKMAWSAFALFLPSLPLAKNHYITVLKLAHKVCSFIWPLTLFWD